jgi:hypothetical protein
MSAGFVILIRRATLFGELAIFYGVVRMAGSRKPVYQTPEFESLQMVQADLADWIGRNNKADLHQWIYGPGCAAEVGRPRRVIDSQHAGTAGER